MTEREKQRIEYYLPNPKDKSLEFNEYFVLDTAQRCRRVYVAEILSHGVGDGVTYICREVSTGKIIDAGWGSRWRGFRMGELYDNAQDCKDRTHQMFDGWETLREIQKKAEDEEENESIRKALPKQDKS